MKKITSCFIIGLLFWSSVVSGVSGVSFSATPPPAPGTQTAAQLLKQWKLIEGNPDGSINELGVLTRAEMMVILSKLNGEYEEAKYFTGTSKFKDVSESNWFYPYVSYAEFKKWSAGDGKGNFKPNSTLSYNEALAFVIKSLGHTVPNFGTVKTQAQSLGLEVSSTIGSDRALVRTELFSVMMSALKLNKKGTYTSLAAFLNIEYVDPLKTNPFAFNIATVKAVNQKLVVLTAQDPINEKHIETLAIKDASGNPLSILGQESVSKTEVWLTTSPMKAKTPYAIASKNTLEMILNDSDDKAPEVSRIRSTSQDYFHIDFSEDMSAKSVLDPSNYMLNNSLSIKSIEFDTDKNGANKRWSVKIKTSKQSANTSYTIKYGKNLTDLAGNPLLQTDIKRLNGFVGPSIDMVGPKLTQAEIVNLTTIKLSFEEASNLDAYSAESLNTYVLTNKTNALATASLLSAKLIESEDGYYRTVMLTTTPMTPRNQYEVKALTLFDEFNNQISTTDYFSAVATATGVLEDLKITQVQAITTSKIKVAFNKSVEKDSELSMQYTLSNNLDMVSLEYDPYSKNVVYLTTSLQNPLVKYTLTVGVSRFTSGKYTKVSDLKYEFTGAINDPIKPRIQLAETVNHNNEAAVLITFSEPMSMPTALSKNGYTISDGVGEPHDVIYKADNQVLLKTKPLKDNVVYTVMCTNVMDLAGNVLENDKARQNFVGKSDYTSTTAKVINVIAIDNRTITVVFNKPMRQINSTPPFIKNAIVTDAATDPDNYKVSNKTTGNTYTPKYTAVNTDQTEVSLRFDESVFNAETTYELMVNSDGEDAFGGGPTAIRDLSDTKIALADAKRTFVGNGATLSKPSLVNIQAINSTELHLVFNDTVTVTGLLNYGDISVSTNLGGVLYINPNFSRVLSDKPNTIACRMDGKLPGTAMPRVTVNSFEKMKDRFYDQPVDNVASLNNVVVVVPNIDSIGPVPLGVDVKLGQLTVKFDRAIDSADRYDYRIITDHGSELPISAEFDTFDKAQVILYYNYTHTVVNKPYSVNIAKNAVQDAVGNYNLMDASLPFTAVSGTIEEPIFALAKAMSQNTIEVGFNQPVTNQVGAVTGETFVISTINPYPVVTIEKAYNGERQVELVEGKVPHGKYFTTLHLKVNKMLYAGAEHYIFLNREKAYLQNQYGMPVFQMAMQPFTGSFDLSKVRLSSGIAVTSNGAGLLNIKEDATSAPLALTGYTKFLTFKQETQYGLYDAVQDVAKTYNAADLTKTVAKGTEVEMGVPGGKTYDVLIVLLDADNRVVGYYLHKGLAVQ